MRKFWKYFFLVLGIILPIVFIIIVAALDSASIWNTWGKQEDGSFISPDVGNYILMIIFKLVLYIIPSFIIAIGLSIENKKKKERKIYLYYFLNTLMIWSICLLIIKLLSDNIFELERIWGFKLFSSVKEITTLAGFIISLLLKQNIKFDSVKEIETN